MAVKFTKSAGELENARKAFEAGNNVAALDALFLCLSDEARIPKWIVAALPNLEDELIKCAPRLFPDKSKHIWRNARNDQLKFFHYNAVEQQKAKGRTNKPHRKVFHATKGNKNTQAEKGTIKKNHLFVQGKLNKDPTGARFREPLSNKLRAKIVPI